MTRQSERVGEFWRWCPDCETEWPGIDGCWCCGQAGVPFPPPWRGWLNPAGPAPSAIGRRLIV